MCHLDYKSFDSESISNDEPKNHMEKSFEIEDIVNSMLVEINYLESLKLTVKQQDSFILYCICWKDFGFKDDC